MKLRTHLPFAVALAAAATALLVGTPAQAASYSFHQAGFAEGASVSGGFSGTDLDGDGWLFGYELTAFTLSFSGNAAVPAFRHTIENLNGIEYRIGAPTIGGDPMDHLASSGPGDSHEIEYAAFGWPDYSVPGRIIDQRNETSTTSLELIRVSAVPEPGTWTLLLAGLGVVARRRRGVAVTPTLAPGLGAALERTWRRAKWGLRDALAAAASRARAPKLDAATLRDLGLSHASAAQWRDPAESRRPLVRAMA